MRPGQNKRMRGRPSSNRRGPNPLTRSYESNGPDVKIRGNAHHVAEKYLQLARDAHTNGDPVAAENYLQHAEHYFRLIASAQAAQLQQQNGASRPSGEGEAEDLDDEDDGGGLSDRFASPAERAPAPYQPQPAFAAPVQGQPQTQPFQDRAPYESDRQPQSDRGYQGRPDRSHNRPPDRGPRDNRPYQERQELSRDNRDSRDNRFPRDNRPREFPPLSRRQCASGGRQSERGGARRRAAVVHNRAGARQCGGGRRGNAILEPRQLLRAGPAGRGGDDAHRRGADRVHRDAALSRARAPAPPPPEFWFRQPAGESRLRRAGGARSP